MILRFSSSVRQSRSIVSLCTAIFCFSLKLLLCVAFLPSTSDGGRPAALLSLSSLTLARSRRDRSFSNTMPPRPPPTSPSLAIPTIVMNSLRSMVPSPSESTSAIMPSRSRDVTCTPTVLNASLISWNSRVPSPLMSMKRNTLATSSLSSVLMPRMNLLMGSVGSCDLPPGALAGTPLAGAFLLVLVWLDVEEGRPHALFSAPPGDPALAAPSPFRLAGSCALAKLPIPPAFGGPPSCAACGWSWFAENWWWSNMEESSPAPSSLALPCMMSSHMTSMRLLLLFCSAFGRTSSTACALPLSPSPSGSQPMPPMGAVTVRSLSSFWGYCFAFSSLTNLRISAITTSLFLVASSIRAAVVWSDATFTSSVILVPS
mmetsp:Transcript_33027/g.84658  ORF Transcript_33027/g.84658 Transcript_33027/m.84658 type:complete len:373 (+) Transcript_33027:1131-2249(+)